MATRLVKDELGDGMVGAVMADVPLEAAFLPRMSSM